MQKVLFLGDSITDGGVYVSLVDTYFRAHACFSAVQIDNIGLCSENTSGLTEAGHPGDRPNIATRIDKIIDFYHPDIAVVLYGINDGIYKPLDSARFEAFQHGICALVARLNTAGAKVYLCTPTAFDKDCSASAMYPDPLCPEDGKTFAGYNQVMTEYANWVRTQMVHKVEKLIDINLAMNQHICAMRTANPNYKSGDGIHPNLEMSAVMATTILTEGFGCHCNILEELKNAKFAALFRVVRLKNQQLHSYQKETLGHTSPFHDHFLPLAKLEKRTQKLNQKIRRMTGAKLRFYQFDWCRKFRTEKFIFQNFEAVVVFPKIANRERNWLWRTEFFGAFPDADNIALARGYHVVHLSIGDNYGCPNAVQVMRDFFSEVIKKYALNPKVTFLALSRGGLYAVNFAARYPQLVRGLLLDSPVVDIRSWPKGDKTGCGSSGDWDNLRLSYQQPFADLEGYGKELIQKLALLPQNNIPTALLSNQWDEVVPFEENGVLVREAYHATAPALYFEAIKPLHGHHPHGGECTLQAFLFLEQQGEH